MAVIKIYKKLFANKNKLKNRKKTFFDSEFEDNNFFGKARITFQHNTIYEYISSISCLWLI